MRWLRPAHFRFMGVYSLKRSSASLLIVKLITIEVLSHKPITMKKPILLLVCCLNFLMITAQNNYEKLWQEVTELELQGKFRDAAKVVDKIRKKAERNDQSDQIVKSFIFQSKFALLLEENAQDNIIADIEEAINNKQFPTDQILQSVYAGFLEQYLNKNLFKIQKRSLLDSSALSNNYKLWDAQTFITRINALYKASTKNETALQQLAVTNYSAILTYSSKSTYYRPTLYDFLAHRALDFFKQNHWYLKPHNEPYILNDPSLLSISEKFRAITFKTPDSILSKVPALKTFQKLESFHIGKDSLAYIDAVLERLKFVRNHSSLKEKDALYFETLQNLLARFKDHEASSMVAYEVVTYYVDKSKVENAKFDPNVKDSRLKAVAICDRIIARFPNSDGGTMCHLKRNELLSKKISLQTENFVVPEKPFLARVSFKNIDSLYMAAYAVSKDYFEGYQGYQKDSLLQQLLQKQKPVIKKLFRLPLKKDLYEYSTEIDMPALPAGNYVLVASGSQKCELITQVYAYASIQATVLSLLSHESSKHLTLQLLNRENGQPLSGAQVKAKGIEDFEVSGETNALGMFQIKRKEKFSSNLNTEIVFKNDTLKTNTPFLSRIYSNNNYEDEERQAKMLLFLDRSIYRPGQTMYFKGILVEKEKGLKKVVPNTWVTVVIYDANYEELKEFRLKTNNYGSVHGEFTLPKNVLTGEFTIEMDEDYNEDGKDDPYWDKVDDVEYAELEFSVEEYKRPRFEVNFDEVTENYKLGDSVKVAGKVVAFFGAPISNANVSYTVERMPYAYLRFNTNPDMLLEGSTETNESGNFSLSFSAVPQIGAHTSQEQTYSFIVKATVTDLNGETRSSEKIIYVGNKNIKASLFISEQVNSEEKENIVVTTQNLNNQDIPADVTIEIYKLKSPNRILRPKPWNIVEVKYLEKEDFINKFPNEVYDSTDLKSNWPKAEKVLSKTFNTANQTSFTLEDHKNWKPGVYVIELTATDERNDTRKITRRFEIYRTNDNYLADQKLFEYQIVNSLYKQDGYVLLNLKTAAEELQVFVKAKYLDEELVHKRLTLRNGESSLKIPVEKFYKDRIDLDIYFVKYNSVYHKSFAVNFKVTSKVLNFETLSFRDRLMPDAKETWSFKITDPDQKNASAEVLAAMYDASLDQFKEHQWGRVDSFRENYNFRTNYIRSYNSFENQNFKVLLNPFFADSYSYITNYSQLNWFGFNFGNTSSANKFYLKKVKETKNKPLVGEGTISGVITDESGLPLPGATIVVQGTTNGTTADFDGFYSLNAPKGSTLIISYLGYASQAITIQKLGIINTVLQEDSAALEEVVVTAMGIQKKSAALGYATVVYNLAEDSNISNHLLETLQGKVAGIQVNYAVGEPGASSKILIRGNNSISNTNTPLFIVDGKIISLSNGSGIHISPEMIENMQVLKGAAATSLYGSRANGGVVIISTKKGMEELLQTEARTNLKETAFFFPTLTTNAKGEIQFNFDAPQALTKWKFIMLGHTKDLKTGGLTKTVVTQKNLSVIPNYPRFVREKDTLVFSAKLSNMTSEPLTGTTALQLFDAFTLQPLNKNIITTSMLTNFTLQAGGNTEVSWKLVIPEGLEALQFKVVAKAGNHSDGEAKAIPVLSNRTLITESQPLWVPAGEHREISFSKLLSGASKTRKNHQFTIEYTSNPAWLALKSLPYLMEFPHECAEQTFSRFYANSIAAHLVNSNPEIKEVFEVWVKNNVFESVLQKNEELKNIVLAETPWIQDALSDAENKARIAGLFKKEVVAAQQQQAIKKLKEMQLPSGGFPWFAGGSESYFITRHIVAGFGHLEKLNIEATNADEVAALVENGIDFLDNEFLSRYKRYGKMYKAKKLPLSASVIHYLYARSFYLDTFPVEGELAGIWPEYMQKAKESWLTLPLYQQGMVALFLNRLGETKTAKAILEALEEQAVKSEENGMYWKENTGGWYWYNASVETQALLIEAFTEIANNKKVTNALKMWLLKNKSTQNWGTTKATTEAIYALLMQGSEWLSVTDNTTIILGDKKITSKKLEATKKEAGTGYFKLNWKPDEISPEMGTVKVINRSNIAGYGGAYWQYFEDLDKIKKADNSPLIIKKGLFIEGYSEEDKVLKPITKDTPVKIGGHITVRIEITSKDNLEFVHLKDMRASGLEPVEVLSEYKWQDGLGYYQSNKDAATHFFFDELPKGTYVFEYRLRANNSGDFSNGISTMQSMYAPAYSTHSKGIRLQIEK
jgi:TonB-dependent SusC/RagA subfamily outer membrane receptor